MDIQKLTKNKFWFTLVELIVVITIIAILWTIAFIYFGVHNKNSRDTVRISDIKNIEKWLGIYIAEKWFYPEPDSWVNITYSWWLAWTQWIVWENLLRWIEMTKVFDPLTSNPYTYSVTSPKNGYQIWAIREWNVAQSFNLVNKTYALEKTAYALIRWTYNQRVIRVSSWSTDFILAVPSIITSDLNNTDLWSIISNKLLVFSNYRNIPSSYQNMWYTMTGWFDFIHWRDILIFSWSLYDASTDLNRLMILNWVKNAYKWTIIWSSYNDIINLDISTNQKQALLLTNSFKNIVWEYKEKLLTGSYYYQLSAWYRHTCWIKVWDKLYCWWLNSNWQLWDNTTIQKNWPTLVYSWSDFIQVSTNYIHTCAIKTDWKLYCWWYNWNWRLWDNTTSQRNLPTLINSWSTYKQISVWWNHTCWIKSNNKLFCWWYNNYWQLWDWTIVQKLSPVPIDSANDYIQVRAGWNSSWGHTCAIRSDWKLYCWWYNWNWQLWDN